MTAYRDRGKRVVNGEAPRDRDVHAQLLGAGGLEVDADEAALRDQLITVRDKIGVLAVAVGLDRAGVPLCHALGILVINVDDAGLAAPEQQSFAGEVFRHILVLDAADMVAREVGEDAVIKEDTVGAVPFQTQWRRLDDHRPAALADHAAHRLLDLVALGGGIVGFVDAVADQNA